MVYQQTKLKNWISLSNLSWSQLSYNPNAIELLKANLHKIDWEYLSMNVNAIEIIEKNLDKISSYILSTNPNAIKILQANPNKIEWDSLSLNPSIFRYDYELIKNNNKELNEEIIIKALHPKRMLRLMELYGEDEIYKYYFDEQ
jgi:hypothetical protein